MVRRFSSFASVGVVLLLFATPAIAADAPQADFEHAVAPILLRRCLGCHNASEAKGELVLETAASLAKGGASGEVVVAGKPDESALIERLIAGEMPPAEGEKSNKLPDQEIATLRAWIAAGAKWPDGRKLDPYEATSDSRGGLDWWSLQPVVKPDVPQLTDGSRVSTPVDAFILQRLAEEKLSLAPPADRRTLVRRVYFDLVGLPPTPEEVEQFVADDSPTAYEALVDRLLASPHFGERWARYWLDLVRYADTSGYERDQEKPGAWKYRDWVIKAFNDDKPYDQFILEQLAGDEMPDRSEQTVIATGFLRLGTWNDEPNDPFEYKYERLEDMVHATSTALLAMTVKCARCHDHKFDPIRQTDYYRMGSIFWAGPCEGGRDALGGPNDDLLGVKGVLGWTDRGREVSPLRLLKKGDPHRPEQEVPPGYLSMIPALDQPMAAPPAEAKTTHRRLQWARWVTDPKHPLTARVMVNRIWQHHFGEGLVRSPDNFGFKGERPTHPELLDWLASELVSGGWKLKPIHRQIVLSSIYRQSSLHPLAAEYAERDSANRWHWRASRRRLDAEALRDATLAVSGQLNRQAGGPGFHATVSAEALEGLSRKSGAWKVSPLEEQRRRSVYMYAQRSLASPLMATFDLCDTTQPCAQRDVTIVAPQALALLNNQFIHEASSALAGRVKQEAGEDRERQIEKAWRLALGRAPTDSERKVAAAHLEKQERNYAGGTAPNQIPPTEAPPITQGLVLSLRADRGVTLDADGRVSEWKDASGQNHDARQDDVAARPQLASASIGERPALRFSGQRQFLNLAGQVLTGPQFTVLAVVTDEGGGSHREIFSNWNGSAGNSTSSVFLGTTATDTVRFSDAFAGGPFARGTSPSLLAAISGEKESAIYQNENRLATRPGPLPNRNVTGSYVIGQQGNIQGEFWTGLIAELLVYDRALDTAELDATWKYVAARYRLSNVPARDPRQLALESLCHVLLNANEFIYVD